ncbi:protein IWS1 homolog [Planococcus citri]|uniref:protein IWS1 homolog n=1 Tax=Planococcus citri TaxID=170843 RepID=UPI0031F8901E
MKILIAIAVLLNVYGVLSEPHIFNRHDFSQPLGDPHPRRHHEHRSHHHNEGSVLTTDELAEVLLSLPGSLGTEAYKTFLALGRFLPADTKAHKFFTSIPKAIRRKSNDQFAAVPTMPNMPSVQFSPNSMFMMQPAGYHMVPLPLHPMFSSSPLDYVTRVPCRHTKVIRVPMHTFDVQISAITRKFSPSNNSFDAGESDDDDEGDDSMNSGLKDLLDLISSDDDGDDVDGISGDKKSSEEADVIDSQPENDDSPKLDDSESEAPSSTTDPNEGNQNTPVENGADELPKEATELPKEEDAQKVEENLQSVGNESKTGPAAGEGDGQTTAPVSEGGDGQTTAPVSEEMDTSAPPAPPTEGTEIENAQEPKAEEVEPVKQEGSVSNETQSQEVESVPASPAKPDKKKKKKPATKKGKAAAEAETEPALEEPAPAPQAEQDEDLMEDSSKPIQTKKGRRKKTKQQQ